MSEFSRPTTSLLEGQLRFVRLEAEHLLSFERQASQKTVLGLDSAMDRAQAQAFAAQERSWAALSADRIVGCFGIIETFPGRQGTAWAIFGTDIGRHHHRITRFARALVEGSGLARVEAVTACSDIEPIAAQFPQFDNWALVRAAMAAPTPEMRWATKVGLRPAALLRRYGAASETVMLFERLG